MTFKGAIFDLDGVIVDTVPLHFVAWRYLFADKFGVPFSEKDYEEKVDGRARIDGVRAMLSHLSFEEAVAAGEVKQQYFLKLLQSSELKIFPSSFALIDELLANNIKLAIASSSKNAPDILEKVGLAHKMHAIISGNDFKQGKPHPEIFLRAKDALKLQVNECVVFEDAKAGVEAAKAGGFFCVGVDRHGKTQNYTQADLVVKDLAEVNYRLLNDFLA